LTSTIVSCEFLTKIVTFLKNNLFCVKFGSVIFRDYLFNFILFLITKELTVNKDDYLEVLNNDTMRIFKQQSETVSLTLFYI
jgi:hypothetical protein